ncbi:hypothetical protein Drorol1_Dr00021077 [Drosera rotundifolia]
MSRSAKFKLDKTKVKVVFRLQFHATHIPQTGWDKLFVSCIPADTGKATAKTTRANVRNGTCKWADPIYETTRLLQDVRTKEYEEKLYKLIVAMGSSRSSLLGESNINLADYVTALKPTVVTLPLQGSDAGTDLNVTIQLLTSKTGFREFEQQRELTERRLQTASHHDAEKMLIPRDYSSSLIHKVNSRVKFKRETGELSLLGEASLNEEFPDLASGFDGMSNTSDSLYAEKNDMSTMHENDSIKSTMSGDYSGLSLAQSPNSGKRDSSASVSATPGASDWIQSWGTDPQMDNYVVNVYEENSRLRGSLEVAELSMHEMQLEVNTLQCYADGIGVETHKLTQELASEIASGQKLAKEISSLKSEYETLKGDLESLRSSGTLGGTNSSGNEVMVRKESDDGLHQDEIQHQSDTSWTKGLIVLEDEIRKLQNKAYLSFRGNEVQFLVSDLEALLGVVHDLRQEGSVPELAIKKSGSVDKQMMNENIMSEIDKFKSGSGFGLDLCHPEDVLQCLSVPVLASHGANSSDNSTDKHEELFKLLRELDESKAEKEALVTKMDQMECYYEALIQELEENQKRMLGEYQNIRNEHSGCIYTISSTKAQMEAMHQAMSEKILKLEKERCELESEKRELDSLNKELERRASTSETTLRRLRLNYSIAVNQLHKELETLSCQIVSMYETNENLVKKVFEEALKPCFEGYSEATWSENAVKRDLNILEDLRKSITSRKELHRESEEELYGICLAYSQLDVFGQILQHSLREATAEIIFGKESLCTLTELLEASTKSNESLKAELQTAANDISALTVDKAICISKCYEMTQQNQILEEKFRGICDENRVLVQKAAEWEAVAIENKSYKDRYEACDVDRQELASLCEQSMMENTNLSNRNFFLQEELSAMKNELGKLASSKESLQRAVDYMQEQLAALSASYGQQLAQVSDKSLAFPHLECDNFMGIFSWLGEVQDMSCKRIHQLMQEKRDLEDERNLAEFSLSSINHEAEVVRQKYEHDIRNMVLRLDASSTLVEKLEGGLQDIDDRLKQYTGAEAKYAMVFDELSSDYARMQAELQDLSIKNGDLLQQILSLGSITEELERSKLVLAEVSRNKEELTTFLKDKVEESNLLVAEVNTLKGALKSLNDEFLVERGLRSSLEREVSVLNSQLKEEHLKLLEFQKHAAEFVHLKQLLSNLEVENSTLLHELSQVIECRPKTLADSSAAEMESRDTHESLLAADVALAFLTFQYKSHTEELLQQLGSRDGLLQDFDEKHLTLDTMRNHYGKENGQLLSTLESLKSDLQISTAQKKALEDRYMEDKSVQQSEIKQLSFQLESCQEAIDSLSLSNQESEIKLVVLKLKLDEHCNFMNEEFTGLEQQNNELNHRLHEQTLKTEEFKNLSIHLKEVKDQIEADFLQLRQQRETEGAKHESLRIAFIKEQYEGKLQELRQQLSISKKHGEEMLCKLQDVFNQLEKTKKSEASQIKRNEELSQLISALEEELNSALSDVREKANAYDQVKAELECSLISLECCKEEKQQLIDCLQECNEEKHKLEAEFSSMRETLESSMASMKPVLETNGKPYGGENCSAEQVEPAFLESEGRISTGREASVMTSVSGSPSNGFRDCPKCGGLQDPLAENGILGSVDASIMTRSPPSQGALECIDVRDSLESRVNGEDTLENDAGHADNQLTASRLRSRINKLHSELERMKVENTANGDSHIHPFEPNTDEGIESEMAQLEKVNKELGSISPAFNDFADNGSPIERVLALELELADALRAKRKSSILFQSSFLKQFGDEAAVLRSFRDINELIKDMLEMKARYSAMDRELAEMHHRYSELSLQYAEVEGERQKLMIMLKNGSKASKRLLSCSSSASLPES